MSTCMHLIGWACDAPGAAWSTHDGAVVEGRAVERSAHDGALGQVEGGRGNCRVGAIEPERRIGHVDRRRRPRRRPELKERGLAIAATSEAIGVIKRH